MKQPYTFEEKAFARLCTHTKPCDCKKDGVLSGRHIRAITLRDEKEIDNWNDLYKFAFVRNPYDRMVSFWAFYRNIGTSMTNVRRSAEMMSFDDWVKYLRKKSFAKMGEHPESLVPPWRWPQVSWIEKDGKQIIDFVGRYENLQEDFEYICKHIGCRLSSSERRYIFQRSALIAVAFGYWSLVCGCCCWFAVRIARGGFGKGPWWNCL